jgi:hypothetical protein
MRVGGEPAHGANRAGTVAAGIGIPWGRVAPPARTDVLSREGESMVIKGITG